MKYKRVFPNTLLYVSILLYSLTATLLTADLADRGKAAEDFSKVAETGGSILQGIGGLAVIAFVLFIIAMIFGGGGKGGGGGGNKRSGKSSYDPPNSSSSDRGNGRN